MQTSEMKSIFNSKLFTRITTGLRGNHKVQGLTDTNGSLWQQLFEN
jgi:hypothetical protein